VFSDPFAKYSALLHPDAMVMVAGRGEVNGDVLKILVNEVYPMDSVRERFTKSIVLSFNVMDVQETTITRLREVMESNKGNVPCYFNVKDAMTTRMYHSRKYTVEPTEQFVSEVTRMLGPQSIRFASDLSRKPTLITEKEFQ